MDYLNRKATEADLLYSTFMGFDVRRIRADLHGFVNWYLERDPNFDVLLDSGPSATGVIGEERLAFYDSPVDVILDRPFATVSYEALLVAFGSPTDVFARDCELVEEMWRDWFESNRKDIGDFDPAYDDKRRDFFSNLAHGWNLFVYDEEIVSYRDGRRAAGS